MQRRKTNRLDNVGIGFLAGFLLPVIVFIVVWQIGKSNMSFSDFVQSLMQLNVLIKLGSLCVFLNSANT